MKILRDPKPEERFVISSRPLNADKRYPRLNVIGLGMNELSLGQEGEIVLRGHVDRLVDGSILWTNVSLRNSFIHSEHLLTRRLPALCSKLGELAVSSVVPEDGVDPQTSLGLQAFSWEGLVVHPVLRARGLHPRTTLVRSEISLPGPWHGLTETFTQMIHAVWKPSEQMSACPILTNDL